MAVDHGEIHASLVQLIEDAILLGNVKELDDVLALALTDPDFPHELRYGLEALRYFRANYGKGGIAEPAGRLQKQRAIVTETAWGAELLEKLGRLRKSTFELMEMR